MRRASLAPTDPAALQAEMRQIFPVSRPANSERLKKLRADNQDAFDRSLGMRQRPTRVS